MQAMNVSILGLGLMGSSLALALRKRGFCEKISGYARREDTCEAALDTGVVDAVFTDPQEAVRDADLVVVCVPIWTIAQLAERIAPAFKQGAVVTDVGSTKLELLNALSPLFLNIDACFVGSHPIAGSEKTGLAAGNPDLYDGRLTVVCPSSDTPFEAKEVVCSLWRSVGSEVVEMSPEAHDATLAATSHLPHMVAAALTRAVANGDPAARADFCGTGFYDTSRVASGSPGMWVDIIDTNRRALERELNHFHQELKGLIDILQHGDGEAIRQWLEQAAQDRNQMLQKSQFLKS